MLHTYVVKSNELVFACWQDKTFASLHHLYTGDFHHFMAAFIWNLHSIFTKKVYTGNHATCIHVVSVRLASTALCCNLDLVSSNLLGQLDKDNVMSR